MGKVMAQENNAARENARANCGEEYLTQQDMKDRLLEMKKMKEEMRNEKQLTIGHFGGQPNAMM